MTRSSANLGRRTQCAVKNKQTCQNALKKNQWNNETLEIGFRRDVLLQVLDELKQRELGNTEKEEKLQVKKKTIDLLPEADNNVVQLQVGELRDG